MAGIAQQLSDRALKLVNTSGDAGARHVKQFRNFLDGSATIFVQCGDYCSINLIEAPY